MGRHVTCACRIPFDSDSIRAQAPGEDLFKDSLRTFSYEIETICNNVSCVNARADEDSRTWLPLAINHWPSAAGYSEELHSPVGSLLEWFWAALFRYCVARNVNFLTAIHFVLLLRVAEPRDQRISGRSERLAFHFGPIQ